MLKSLTAELPLKRVFASDLGHLKNKHLKVLQRRWDSRQLQGKELPLLISWPLGNSLGKFFYLPGSSWKIKKGREKSMGADR